MNTQTKYPLIIRLLHWGMGLIIVTLLCVGLYMASIPDDAANKYNLYPLHKAFGFIVLTLLLVRLPARILTTTPSPQTGLKTWEIKLSHAVHGLIYLAMFTMTFSGYLMSSTFPYSHGLDIFGLFTIPDITSKSEQWSGIFHEIHEITAFLFITLLILHIAGALKHRFIDAPEQDVLKRML
ncbi:MAG: cytochrome b [Gammaproteobacteria bacterium]|nr:cytochrome b [Gammaproteobacteria bacterium]